MFVVNKADKEGADKVARETRAMLDLFKDNNWIPPVMLKIAENGSCFYPGYQGLPSCMGARIKEIKSKILLSI